MKKKVLVLTSTFPRWEGDTVPPFVFELSKRLAKQFEVHVLAPFSKGSKKYEMIGGMYIHRFKYWFNRQNNLADGAILPNLKKNKLLWFQVPPFIISEFFSIARIVKKYKIDTIHAHWTIPQGLLAVLYKKIFRKNVKIICTSHGGDIFGLRKLNFLKRWVVNNSDYVTVVSNAIKEEFMRLGIKDKTKLKVIPMGVDTTLFNPDKYDESIKKKYDIDGPFLLFVGRLSEKKGVKYLIDAMPNIVEKFPKTKLLIIGDGEDKEELISQAKRAGLLDKNIIFTGAIHNNKLPYFYATADIFIGPSIIAKSGDREGLPVTLMEAMASGCIVVATDLEGNSDLIDIGQNGFLVEQKNPNDIAKKVIYLLQNKTKMKNIKSKGVKYISDNFDWKAISEKYGDLIG